MAGRLMRRSGVAVGLVAELLKWRPDAICQVGIGCYHHEVEVLHEEWPDVKWIGFEPHSDIVRGLGNYPGIVYPVAVGEKNGIGRLWTKNTHKDGSSLFEFCDHGCRNFEVPMVCLDHFDSKELMSIRRGLLWLDCEGSELNVLRGARNFLKSIEVVNVELTSNPPGKGWGQPEDIHVHLVHYGFWLQWLHTQRSASGQVDAIYVRHQLFRPEFCCVPQERMRWKVQESN